MTEKVVEKVGIQRAFGSCREAEQHGEGSLEGGFAAEGADNDVGGFLGNGGCGAPADPCDDGGGERVVVVDLVAEFRQFNPESVGEDDGSCFENAARRAS
ncbi:hypothetical protein [Rhodococcus sp. 27YEA15]|uniref:hypothetical protein n=1 Tax=Rhodococcus sp. 27YEA15 TaxID=3156259 RepID=UPI003C7BA721